MSRLVLLVLCISTSACAVAEKMEAVENIELSDCVTECKETEVENCLNFEDDNSCFAVLETCFDMASSCFDSCLSCEEDGTCISKDTCTQACNIQANNCTDGIDYCVDVMLDRAESALIDGCFEPFIDCVSVCIAEVEEALD